MRKITYDIVGFAYVQFCIGRRNMPPRQIGRSQILAEIGRLGSDSPEGEAQFSPDGRWLAYVSEETGRPESTLCHFPVFPAGFSYRPREEISRVWRHDGKEIFFVAPDGTMTAVLTDGRGDILKAGVPHALFQTEIAGVSHSFYQYDVTAFPPSGFSLIPPGTKIPGHVTGRVKRNGKACEIEKRRAARRARVAEIREELARKL